MKEYNVEEHLDDFRADAPEHKEVKNLAELPAEDRERMLRAGIDGGEKAAGTIVHSDHDTVFCNANLKGVQVMPVSYAQFKYGLEGYSWKLIEKDKDAFTERAASRKEGGYFIRAEKGA